MAKRRRRQRVQWLPGLGDEQGEFPLTVQHFATDVEVSLAHGVEIAQLTFDWPIDPDVANVQTTSMADFVGSAYTLERIVGKIFLNYAGSASQPVTPAMAYVGFGFFVARADHTNPQVPVGNFEDYDPLLPANLMEPWIWRRTWLLNNGALGTVIGGPDLATNRWCGSVLDGPHIDTSVRRRIDDDHRLWAVQSSCALSGSAGDGDGTVHGYLDVRLLGSLRRNRNQSAF